MSQTIKRKSTSKTKQGNTCVQNVVKSLKQRKKSMNHIHMKHDIYLNARIINSLNLSNSYELFHKCVF